MQEEDDETVLNLENSLINFYNEIIPRILYGEPRPAVRCEYGMMHVEDEHAYWKHRLEDLEVTLYELEYNGVPEIANRLRKCESVFVQLYDNMIKRLKNSITESRMNRDLLQVLNKPCLDLYNFNSLSDIMAVLPDMHLFEKAISIYGESSYYHESSHFDNLCRCLCNQIVYICRKTIDTTAILTTDIEFLRDLIKACLACCNLFLFLYKEAIQEYNHSQKDRLMVKAKSIYTFISRCEDLEIVLKAKEIFKRSNVYQYDIQEPSFSYPHETYTEDNTEQHFDSIIFKLKEPFINMFNVKDTDWVDHYQIFQDEFDKLCIKTKTVANMALDIAYNEMEYINILLYLHYIYKGHPPKKYFNKKTNELYKRITTGIESLTEELLYKKEHEIYFKLPKYSGVCMFHAIQYNKTNVLKNVFTDKSYLMNISDIKQFENAYNSYVSMYDERMVNVFQKWYQQINPDIEDQFYKNILIEREMESGYNTFTIDLNNHVYEQIEESECWKLIKPTMPFTHQEFTSNTQKIKNLHTNVTKLIIKYNNYILTGLTEQEKLLFSITVQTFVKLMIPLVITYTWSQSSTTEYIVNCYDALELINDTKNVYKYCTEKIWEICGQIATTPLIILKLDETKDLKTNIDNLRKNIRVMDIINLYNEIIRCGTNVYERFGKSIKYIIPYWEHYVEVIDNCIYKSLCLNVQFSMQQLLEEREYVIYAIDVSLQGSQIKYSPSLKQLVVFSERSLLDITNALNVIPRLWKTFKLKKMNLPTYSYLIANDQKCGELQMDINKNTEDLLINIKNYMKQFTVYSDIWTVDKGEYFNKFKADEPSTEVFDMQLKLYNTFHKEVKDLEIKSTISCAIIRTEKMKAQILKLCEEWIFEFSQLLLDITDDLLKSYYEDIRLNGIRLMAEPNNLIEMVEYIQVKNDILSQCDNLKDLINLISNNVTVLEKYGIEMSQAMRNAYNNLANSWDEYLSSLGKAELMFEEIREELKKMVLNEQTKFKEEIEKFCELWENYKKTESAKTKLNSNDALKGLAKMKQKYTEMKAIEKQLKFDLELFNLKYVRTPKFNYKEEMEFFNRVFTVIQEWDTQWSINKVANFWEIKTSVMEETVHHILKLLNKAIQVLKEENWKIIEIARDKVDAFRRVLPLISDLRNPAMRNRHWNEVREVMNKYFDETDHNFTLGLIMQMEMQKYGEQISEISNKAVMELNVENSIKAIQKVWGSTNLIVTLNDNGIHNIKVTDETSMLIEDHLVQLYAMKGSKYISIFLNEAEQLQKGLSLVMEVLDMTFSIQKQYAYAEKIFRGEEIRSKMPNETRIFENITRDWKKITNKMNIDKNIYKACNSKKILKRLRTTNERLGDIQKALETYMEKKRNIFPRFYFISNDDLLDILVNSNKTELLQPHFKKCFDNINKIKFHTQDSNTEAHGMYSAEGEYVPFCYEIQCTGPVEIWFKKIELVMRITLKSEFKNVMDDLKKNLKTRDDWILRWPGQLCITASQIQWTAKCTLALMQSKSSESKKPLKKFRKKQKKMLSKFSDALRSDLKKLDRLKVIALVTIEIHARDVVDNMYKSNCMDVLDFEWIAQLRFYWNGKKDDSIFIQQTITEQTYGYEYLGNSGRLVITPLTDRCYITLTTALHLFRGGSPKGPAGTGKTETVKDLGKNLAYYVIVINCSEGLDYRSMGHMFSGLVQQGAWGCFDEFNRINIEVLSVVAQQIMSIYSALAARLDSFIFEGNTINLVHTCGFFITMNPGYAGRTELPDNLKSMFRAISMMVPDSKLIAEIMLFGEGFKDTRILANKVFVLFSLCRQQLSKQNHYEFGLRGLVALLRYAGQCRRQYSNMPGDEVLLLAMYNMNLAKLTVDDLPLFLGITKDLFPSITLPVVRDDVLISAIERCMIKNNHQPSDAAIAKIVQLYETKVSRHSVMLLGTTGTTKTTTWKTLKDTMILLKSENVPLFETVIVYPLNPKSLSLGELYGEYNLSNGEWLDGVLSSIMRKVCADNEVEQKWILFDGPVDAIWIENMNSVMDDNKVLTLINSERITMPAQVSLLFEVEDLAVASPATVSRCGIVYNDYKDFGWRLYVNSWLNKCEFEPYKDNIENNFNKFIDPILEFKNLNCVETIPLPELNSIQSLCKLLECFTYKDLAIEIPTGLEIQDYDYLIKLWFLFCMVWSVCAVVNEDGRIKIDNYLRDKERVFPIGDTVYHYYVHTNTSQFVHWDNLLQDSQWTYNTELPFYKVIVPTINTIRYNYIVEAYMAKRQPVLLVGPVGTGKTSTVQKALDSLHKDRFLLLTINMSAQTSANNVQETIEGRLEKHTKDLYVPQANKTLITFLDDMNMPEKEVYGAQPPLELIRQWIDYEFWYDRSNQQLKNVKKMLLIGAMGPPGGGRNVISDRLVSCFSVINLTFPEEQQISKIYKTMLDQHLIPFDQNIQNLKNALTEMTIALYTSVAANLLPTPTKMHYLFNLRDISKVFQGLLRSNTDYQKNPDSMLRLWCNEVYRVFHDKLIDEKDHKWFLDQINVQLGKHYEQTYRNLCSSERSLIFCDFLNGRSLYEEVTDEIALRKFIDSSLADYNTTPGNTPMNLVLFRDAIDHICRIVRVISQPRGYILLVGIGGSGRTSLARISNYLCNYNMFAIELTKTYGLVDFKDDLKRLYFQTGVKDVPTSFLFNDTQAVNEKFLEIINNILSTGEVAKLFKEDEFEDIKDILAPIAKRSGIQETPDGIYSFFLDRVRSNMHIILCLSPIGNKFRVRLRQNPSIINCTTIDWFLDWPKEALLEVAFSSLSTIHIMETITGAPRVYDVDKVALTENELRLRIANLFATIHHSVVNYTNIMILELKRYNYVTPTNYLELVSGYKQTLSMKRKEVASSANKLRNGLFKIEETSKKVAGMTQELEYATENVKQSTKDCDEFLLLISDKTFIADQQKIEVDEKTIKIQIEEVECQTMYNAAKVELESAMPALIEAMEALNSLNKKDLSEVKSFSKPPPRVKLVLEAVMILKLSEPTWNEAKRQLGDPNFLNQLKEFDKDHISEKVLKKISSYTKNTEFDPEKVGLQSVAAKSLAQWVISIEKYALIYKIVAPIKEAADVALISLEEKQLSLYNEQQKLAQIQELIKKLKKDFDDKMGEKEQLVKTAEFLKRNLERAASLIEGLSGERTRWIETVKQLDINFDYLPGDCLLSIAFVSYMGPFISTYRDKLLNLWTHTVIEMEIPNDPDYEIKEFLSDPAIIRNWNIHGLPNDDLSTENGIIISRGSRWPLVIDPQCQALKWIKNMEAKNNLEIIDFCLPDYMKILEHSLQEGIPTLLQLTSENIEPAVMPVLLKSIVKKGSNSYIIMGDRQLPYNDNFRFFITTKLRNPYYPPEIFTRATVVNFAIKEEGLEDQLLDVVIRMEKPELKKLKDTLVIDIFEGKRTLVELEDELLRLLNESEGSLLENDELFQTLDSSKITSVNVKEQLESAMITQAEIDFAREGYRPCAKRASILFFVLNELNQIDSMYQFSLDSYLTLFENSIKNSEKSEELYQRLTHLNMYHTYAVYQNTCRGLFEIHKLIFSFQITVSLLKADGLIPANEIAFLLKGGIVLNRETQPENACSSWLPSSNWDNITELDKVPGFLGIEKSFGQYSREWKTWYTAPNPETLNLIGQWNKNCNSFQKMLLVRSLRLDRLSFALANFVSEKLGPEFIEPPVLNLKYALDDSSNKSPLIFLLSPGVDPTNLLIGLATNKDKIMDFRSLSLGQGQAPIATELIKNGQETGSWVFLANCHLSLSWMPQLDKIIDVMQEGKSHRDFRLWLSSNPDPDFPISILQSSIKMTTEPPRGLKANMKRLYQNITEDQFSKCNAQEKYKKLLFSLCFFHSILSERKKFLNLGWNVVYSFNDSDFEVSEILLSIYLDKYLDTPWNALKYLIAGICYGGQVTDDWDRRLLDTYINQYFDENAIKTPYYKLSSMVNYYIPQDGDLQMYREYIDTLPIVDSPEAFGQHSNAEMASLMGVNLTMCDTLMILQGQSSTTAGEDIENDVLVLSIKIAEKIPKQIDYHTTVRNIGAKKNPLDVVLLQEILRYNILLEDIVTSLEGLEKGIKGLVVMSSDLEDVFQCVYEGRVPSQWLKAYPSLMALGSWTIDLIERVKHFTKWAATTRPPVLFWLGAYTYPTGFLTAVSQIYSRKSSVPIDLLKWEFIPQTISKKDISMHPQDGVYVQNLYLEGANWNFDKSHLCESVPLKFITQLPVIQFKPVETDVTKKKGIYHCPVFYYPLRSGTPGRDSFVVVMTLKSGLESPDHWTKRATAVLLNLSS